MSKIKLQDTGSGYNLQTINDNFRKIEEEFNEKVLYRDNPVGEPNELENDLDMNNNRIYNLPEPSSPGEPLRVKEVNNIMEIISEAEEIVTAYEEAKKYRDEIEDIYGGLEDVEEAVRDSKQYRDEAGLF